VDQQKDNLQIISAVCCSVLQCVAASCYVLPSVADITRFDLSWLIDSVALFCRVLQRVAACCSVLQQIDVSRSVLPSQQPSGRLFSTDSGLSFYIVNRV